MRTTLDLPENLLTEAKQLLHFKSKTDVVTFALQELIRLRRINELKNQLGTFDIEVDIKESRRRPVKLKRASK